MRNSPRSGQQGNVLLVVIIVVLSLAGLSLAFLETGIQESKTNLTAGERSRVRYICESGVNEAVGDLLTGGTGNLGTPQAAIPFGGGEYWVIAQDIGGGSYTLTSIGRVNNQMDAIEVVVAPEDIPLFARALFGDLDLGAQGNVFTDSYDSDLGTYASQAVNNHPTTGDPYAKTKGDLGSNRNIILRGGVTVLGNATPGPGYTVQVSGGNVYVEGSTAPAASPTLLPPIEYDPPGASSGNFSKTNDFTFTAGTYHYSGFTAKSSAEIHFQGDVTIYIDGDLSVSGQAQFIVEPDATVVIYHAGNSFSLTGGGVVNETQIPSKFRVLSQASTVKFAGNSAFYGVVYAPHGSIDPGGTSDIFGSFVGRSINVGGTTRFHYDEALSRTSPDSQTTLKRVSWRRISPQQAVKIPVSTP